MCLLSVSISRVIATRVCHFCDTGVGRLFCHLCLSHVFVICVCHVNLSHVCLSREFVTCVFVTCFCLTCLCYFHVCLSRVFVTCVCHVPHLADRRAWAADLKPAGLLVSTPSRGEVGVVRLHHSTTA
jgi:hypothetical protein